MTVYIALYRTLQREPTRTIANCLQDSALALRSAQRILQTLQRASDPRAHVVASQICWHCDGRGLRRHRQQRPASHSFVGDGGSRRPQTSSLAGSDQSSLVNMQRIQTPPAKSIAIRSRTPDAEVSQLLLSRARTGDEPAKTGGSHSKTLHQPCPASLIPEIRVRRARGARTRDRERTQILS